MTSPHHPAPSAVNEALVPVPAERRVFQWHDHASLWFSLGVGLLVMQVGAYLHHQQTHAQAEPQRGVVVPLENAALGRHGHQGLIDCRWGRVVG